MQQRSFKEFKPTTWAINNKTAINVLTIFIIISGVIAYVGLPKEQFPEVVLPQVYIGTPYPGTSPTDIENLITRPIEKQLKSVVGVKKIKSTSIQDYSTVIVEFNSDIEPSLAKSRAQDAVDKAMADLPTDLDNDPSVQEVDFSEMPVMSINISGNYTLDQLKEFAEEIEDRVEALKEITRTDLIGALEKEVQVNLNIHRMQLAGISFNDVDKSIRNENINLAGGNIDIGRLERTLRVVGEFKSVDQIEDIIVKAGQGNTVYLRDIAEVSFTNADRDNFARLNRNPVIALNVIKRSGENLLDAADNINAILDDLKENKFPDDLDIIITNDLSVNTRTAINELLNSVVIGFLLVTLVLLFFMGVKNALFVGLAVPLSSALSMIIIPGMDFTFNIMVTFSFLMALVFLVDNEIVVIENTYRLHTKEGLEIKDAAKGAAGEVFAPVLAGLLTTIAPFFPLLFWPGIMGEFMFFLPATLIIVLTSSLFVAFILNPVFAVQFMAKSESKHVVSNFEKIAWSVGILLVGIFFHILSAPIIGNLIVIVLVLFHFTTLILEPYVIKPFQDNVIPAMMDWYKKVIKWMLVGHRPWIPVFTVVIVLIISIILLVARAPKVEFFPDGEPNSAMVYIELPLGTRAAVTDSITALVEERVFEIVGEENPIVKSIQSNVGIGAGDPMNPDRSVKPHKGKVTVSFVAYGDRNGESTTKYLNKIRENIKGLPGTSMRVEKENMGPPMGKPVNIEISGDDFDELVRISKDFKSIILDSLGIEGIENLKSDLELNKPEIVVNINREKANKEGISSGQIASALRTALYGSEISKFRKGEDDYPIQLRVEEDQRNNISSLMNLRLTFRESDGKFRQVPISSFADISYASNFGGINRIGLKRVVTLSSNVIEGYNANEINAQIRSAALKYDLPNGYEIKQTGEQEDQKETSDFLNIAFGLAIMLVLFILITMFNSISKTLIILTTILFSVVGVLLGYAATGMDFIIVMTMVGIIALAGIVVNNGILLIEFIDEMKARGLRSREAIMTGGSIRFTPVILTASSTFLGLVPLALGMNIDFISLLETGNPMINFLGNDNTMFWAPLSWSIIFGLVFSTALTLIVVPAMYEINYIMNLKFMIQKKRGRSWYSALIFAPFYKLPRFAK